jgi:hypothetical protein
MPRSREKPAAAFNTRINPRQQETRARLCVDWDELGGMGFRICDSLQEFTPKGVLQELTLEGVAPAGVFC